MIEHIPVDSSEDPAITEFAVQLLEQKQDEVLRQLDELDAKIVRLLEDFTTRLAAGRESND